MATCTDDELVGMSWWHGEDGCTPCQSHVAQSDHSDKSAENHVPHAIHSVIKIEQCPRNVCFFFCQLGTMTWYRKQLTNGTGQEIQLKHVKASPRPSIHAYLNPHTFLAIFLRRQSCMRHGGTHVQKSKRLGHKNWPGKNVEKKCVKNEATGLPVRTGGSCNVFITFITIKHP